MIKAEHHPFHEHFFGAYLWVHMRLAFRHIRIHNNFTDNGNAILLIGNHFSWWDGFIARHVNIKVLKRKLHLMMEEEQLAKRKFLSRLGAFSIRKNSRSALESLHYATSILNDPGNLLVLFPQGRFQSLHRQPLTFEKGWFRIIRDVPPTIQIVFMAALTDYFASPRPGLDIYLESTSQFIKDAKTMEAAYNEFYKRAVHMQDINT